MKFPASILPALVSEAGERKVILLFCFLAAIRVFIFCAAFPLYNSVDEPSHFDLVVRYSHGDLPRSFEPMVDEWTDYYAFYCTPEYLYPPNVFQGGQFPAPLWSQPFKSIAKTLSERKADWKETNHESSQPPLYYALEGLWWRAGKAIGLKGGQLPYWIRFSNVGFIVALVWLGYVAARMIFPSKPFLRLGVPALLAFIPQTTFYSVNNDVLIPLTFGWAFVYLIQLLQAEMPGLRQGAFLGIALAATYLIKISSIPLVVISLIAVLFKMWSLRKNGKLRSARAAFGALFVCFALPTIIWLTWCKLNFGDLSGSAGKVALLTWTHKPLSEWIEHPIFEPDGFCTFLSGVIATFWQGEFLWHAKPLTVSAVNLIYVILSIVLIFVAIINLYLRPAAVTVPQRQALWLCLGTLIASLAFLGFLSIIYDFHECFYPSRQHPYFTSGRLILGALIPFLLLWLYGLDHVLSRINNVWARPIALMGIIFFMLSAEIKTNLPVFSSEYNWFHLRHEMVSTR
jgi:hypothetical protein